MRSKVLYCLLAALIVCGTPMLTHAGSGKNTPMASCIVSAAQRHINAHQFDAASKIVHHGLTATPANPDLRMQLGVIYRSTGEYQKARKQFRFALNGRDKDKLWVARCFVEIGRCWELDGDTNEAIMQYKMALANAPDLRDAKYGMERTVAMSQQQTGSNQPR